MASLPRTLTSVCALSLTELQTECRRYDCEQGPRVFHDLLRLIDHLAKQQLLVPADVELACYSPYVLAHAEEFIERGCKRAELPVVFATLRIAGVVPTCTKVSAPVEQVPVALNSLPQLASTPLLSYPPMQRRNDQFIESKRIVYGNRLLKMTGKENPSTLTVGVLSALFEWINMDFFEGVLPVPKFTVSNKLVRAGAYYQRRKDGHKIAFSATRFQDMFSNGKKEAMSSGIRCNNRLEWVEITMEHEMLHYFISFCNFNKDNPDIHSSIAGSHGLLFRKLAEQLFRHTCIKCNTDDTTTLAKITKEQVRNGMTVSFRMRDGTLFSGKVIRVNPTTVTAQYNVTQTIRCPYSLLLSCGY